MALAATEGLTVRLLFDSVREVRSTVPCENRNMEWFYSPVSLPNFS